MGTNDLGKNSPIDPGYADPGWNTGGGQPKGPLDSLGEWVRKAYYFCEDMYYDALDFLNKFVPVYKITDPVDRVIPSFVVFLCVLVVLLGGVAWMLGSGGPDAIPNPPSDSGMLKEPDDLVSPPDTTANHGNITLDPGGDASHATGTAGEREVEFAIEFRGPDGQLLLQPVHYSIQYEQTNEFVVPNKLVNSGLDRARVTNSCPIAIKTNGVCPAYVLTAKSGTFPDASVKFNYLPNLSKLSVAFQSLSTDIGGVPGGCNSNCPPGISTYNLTVNVFGPNETPIVGALVMIEHLTGTPPAPVATALTLPPGSRRFDSLVSGSYRVTVSGEPVYSIKTQDIVLNSDRVLNVSLEPLNRNKRIAFELVREGSNQPVLGLKAYIYHGSVPIPLDPEHGELFVELPENSNRFSLNVAASSTPYFVVIREPGFLLAAKILNQMETSSTAFDVVVLQPLLNDANLAHIHVTALEGTLAPIPQAEVFAWKNGFPFALNLSAVLTNTEGKAELGDTLRLGKGDYRVLVQKIGFDANYYGGATGDYNNVDANGHWYIRAILRNSRGNLRVQTFNSARQALADVNVGVFHVDGGQMGLDQITPASGSVTFSNLPVSRPYYARAKKTGFLTEYSGLLRVQANRTLDKNFFLSSVPSTPAGLVVQYRGLFEYSMSGERSPVVLFEPGKAYWAEFRILADVDTAYSNGLFTVFTPSDAQHFESFAQAEEPKNPLRVQCIQAPPVLSESVPLFGTAYSVSNPENTSGMNLHTGCDPASTSFVLGQLGLKTITQGIYSLEVNVKTPDQTPIGTPVQISVISSAQTTSGAYRADANKTFVVGSPACENDCAESPRDLSWNFWLKSENGNIQPLYTTGTGPTIAPDSSAFRIKLRAWNLQNRPMTNYSVRLSSNAIQFQSPSNPGQFLSSVTFPASLTPYGNFIIDNIRIKTPPTVGTPTVTVEFRPPAGGTNVDSESSPRHLPFNIGGTQQIGHALSPQPLNHSLLVHAFRTDETQNDLGPLEGVQIHYLAPVACSVDPPIEFPSSPFPASAGTTNAQGNLTIFSFSLNTNDCALFRFSKTNFAPHFFYLSAAEYQNWSLPESESCLITDDSEDLVLVKNPPAGSTTNQGTIDLHNDCAEDYDIRIQVVPILADPPSSWDISLSPENNSSFELLQNSNRVLHVGVGLRSPQGLLPIGVFARKKGSSDEFELARIIDVQINDANQNMDIIP